MKAHFNDYDLQAGVDCEAEIRYLWKNFYSPPHWHNGIEIELMLGGSAVHVYNGRQYTISRGDIWYSNYDTCHSILNGDEPVIAHTMFREKLLPEEIRNRLLTAETGTFRLSEQECCVAECLFQKLVDAQNRQDVYTPHYISAILTQMIIECMVYSKSLSPSFPSSLCSKVLSLIHRNYREDISLQKIASTLSVNANYLGRLFLQTTGQTFSEYLTALRMQYALSLLRNTNLSIKEVAFDCGYNSVEYFYASFKKYFGNSPASIRKLNES